MCCWNVKQNDLRIFAFLLVLEKITSNGALNVDMPRKYDLLSKTANSEDSICNFNILITSKKE